MIYLTGTIIAALLALFVLTAIVRTCNRTPALLRRRSLLLTIAVVWAVVVVSKKLYIDDVIPPVDAIRHEATAREIAHHLREGDVSEGFAHLRTGNAGYRFILGAFYALTQAPEICTYAAHSALAFVGLLSLLETVVRQTRSARVPIWTVVLVCAAPSAVFWCTANLKEGLVICGICMMIRVTLESVQAQKWYKLLLPGAGTLVVALLRPHIALAWILALSVGVMVKRKSLGTLGIVSCGVICVLFAAHAYRPGLVSSAINGDILERMGDFHAKRAEIGGSAIKYAGGKPIPVCSGLILLTFRPLPFEVSNLNSLAACLEISLLTLLAMYGCSDHNSRDPHNSETVSSLTHTIEGSVHDSHRTDFFGSRTSPSFSPGHELPRSTPVLF